MTSFLQTLNDFGRKCPGYKVVLLPPSGVTNKEIIDAFANLKELNFEPKVEIEDGLQIFFNWTKDNYTSEIL